MRLVAARGWMDGRRVCQVEDGLTSAPRKLKSCGDRVQTDR